MSRYQNKKKRNGVVVKLPYIERLAKKGSHGLYRYRITKRGKEAYVDYLSRIRSGVTLNRIRYPDHPVKSIRSESDLTVARINLLPYYSITNDGIEAGMNPINIMRLEEKIKSMYSD